MGSKRFRKNKINNVEEYADSSKPKKNDSTPDVYDDGFMMDEIEDSKKAQRTESILEKIKRTASEGIEKIWKTASEGASQISRSVSRTLSYDYEKVKQNE